MTGLCYALTVLIWGTTWIAIKNQLGVVPIEASIAYRFALAGAILFAGLKIAKRLQPIPLRHHPYVVLQSICLFSCNFLCFYIAETLVPSGIVSVIFSAATIFNLANGMESRVAAEPRCVRPVPVRCRWAASGWVIGGRKRPSA